MLQPSSDGQIECLVRPPRVLVACEFSGIVRDAFSRLGAFAMSCDLLPTESEGRHYQGDVRDILSDGWDIMIAHPPCTYLSYVGTRHWNKPGRAEKREEALEFFKLLYNAPIDKICVENPLGYASKAFKRYDQIVQPYYFGDAAQKRTCLWLKNLPPLKHTKMDTLFEKQSAIKKPEAIYTLKTNGKKIHWTEAMHGGKTRSKFWIGIANAMAEQWYPLLTRTA